MYTNILKHLYNKLRDESWLSSFRYCINVEKGATKELIRASILMQAIQIQELYFLVYRRKQVLALLLLMKHRASTPCRPWRRISSFRVVVAYCVNSMRRRRELSFCVMPHTNRAHMVLWLSIVNTCCSLIWPVTYCTDCTCREQCDSSSSIRKKRGGRNEIVLQKC